MQDILWLTEWVLAMSTWICHMATKRKEWSRGALCVGNQNKPVRAYGCVELTKSLWPSKVSIFIKTSMSTLFTQSEKLMENDQMRKYELVSAHWRPVQAQGAFRHCCIWLLSIKGKLASMTCWMVCFNRRGQLQRLVVFFFQLWQVASTPGVSTAG